MSAYKKGEYFYTPEFIKLENLEIDEELKEVANDYENLLKHKGFQRVIDYLDNRVYQLKESLVMAELDQVVKLQIEIRVLQQLKRHIHEVIENKYREEVS